MIAYEVDLNNSHTYFQDLYNLKMTVLQEFVIKDVSGIIMKHIGFGYEEIKSTIYDQVWSKIKIYEEISLDDDENNKEKNSSKLIIIKEEINNLILEFKKYKPIMQKHIKNKINRKNKGIFKKDYKYLYNTLYVKRLNQIDNKKIERFDLRMEQYILQMEQDEMKRQRIIDEKYDLKVQTENTREDYLLYKNKKGDFCSICSKIKHKDKMWWYTNLGHGYWECMQC